MKVNVNVKVKVKEGKDDGILILRKLRFERISRQGGKEKEREKGRKGTGRK